MHDHHHAFCTNTFNTSTTQGNNLNDPLNALWPKSGVPGVKGLPLNVRETVLRTLPTAPRERNSKLLYLARSLADLRSGVPATEWSEAVFVWWQLSLGTVCTNLWATTWKDFTRAWTIGRVPISSSRPIRVMTEAAVVAGPDPRARLLSACKAKASDSVDGTFYLSGRMAGKVAGLPRNTAVRLLDTLEDEGDLIVVERGRPSPVRRRATYYRIGTIDRESCRKHRTRDSQNPR